MKANDRLSIPLVFRRLPWALLALAILVLLEANLAAETSLADEIRVCQAGPPDCDYNSIQAAVDAAGQGDTIKIAAGTYSGVQERAAPAGYAGPPTVAQVVYLSKTLTLQGGYAQGDWTAPDPAAQPTVLDAKGQGRVLLVAGEISPVIEGLRFTGGNATGQGGTLWTDAGGGIYVLTAAANISECIVYSNVAGSSGWGGAGGGLFLANSPATVHDCTIRDNTAATGGDGYGGGVALDGSDAAISGNKIYKNTASSGSWGFGGGVDLFSSAATLSENEIFDNTASTADEGYGGGLHLDGAAASLTTNSIRDNVASTASHGYGGGLSLSEADAIVEGNIIEGNVASAGSASYGYGGGLDLWKSDASLGRNLVRENTASAGEWGYGGGLSFSDSPADLASDAVVDNQAGGNGAGLYVGGAAPTLAHTTIARNTGGDGSGLYIISEGAVSVLNAILASQTTGVVVEKGGAADVVGVLWHDNQQNSGGAGPVVVSKATAGIPAFAADGYHIRAESQAINAGTNAGVQVDIDGQLRPNNQAPDLGADEYWPPEAKGHVLYLPAVQAR